jgi:hypothetical protein
MLTSRESACVYICVCVCIQLMYFFKEGFELSDLITLCVFLYNMEYVTINLF